MAAVPSAVAAVAAAVSPWLLLREYQRVVRSRAARSVKFASFPPLCSRAKGQWRAVKHDERRVWDLENFPGKTTSVDDGGDLRRNDESQRF